MCTLLNIYTGLGKRLRESRLLTPSGPRARVHATYGPLFCPALYIAADAGYLF